MKESKTNHAREPTEEEEGVRCDEKTMRNRAREPTVQQSKKRGRKPKNEKEPLQGEERIEDENTQRNDEPAKHPTRDELLRLGKMLGYSRLRKIHTLWIRWMVWGRGDMTLQAHRGSFKTTCLCIALALMMVEMGEKNILFLRKTEAQVAEVLRQVERILKSPPMIDWCRRRMGQELKVLRCGNGEISTSMYTAPRGAAQLQGLGIGGSLTGLHADVIITDDIVNLKDRLSEAEREHTKVIYRELRNIVNRGGRIINTGTPWHQEDCFSIMPEAVKYDYQRTGLITAGQAQVLRAGMTPSLFAANYELRHIADENALFAAQPGVFTDAELLRDGIAHIDAAYGGEDFTAFTCLRCEGDVIYAYGRLWRGHVDKVLDEILALCDQWMCQPVYCETNADKGFLGRTIREKGYCVRMYHEHMNKFYKISTILRSHWGSISFLDTTDPEYIRQIMEYGPNAQHDDAADSLASAIRSALI